MKGTDVEVLWCPNGTAANKRHGRDGWRFPKNVEKQIRELVGDGSCLHLFGGLARFGTRLDIDGAVLPDVIGDAWLPPFAEGSFDVVVLDRPYIAMCREILFSLLYAASWCARRQVIWLGTIWSPSGAGLRLSRAWLVRCGDSQVVRCLLAFRKVRRVMPMRRFSRGPMMKYNRWLVQPQGLPFGEAIERPMKELE